MAGQPGSERANYIRGEGMVFIADVADRFLTQVEAMQPEQIQSFDWNYTGSPLLDTVASGLHQFSQQITSQIHLWPEDRATHHFFGIRREDIDYPHNRFIFRNGLGDFKFTFFFAPAVAANILNQCADEGYMTTAERISMRFSDWADIIESKWFGTLIHELAFTANGIYTTFGESPSDHGLHALARHLGHRLGITNAAFRLQPNTDNSKLPIIQLHSELRSKLTELMDFSGTAGCPAARHIGRIATEHAQTNPHIQHPIGNERASLKPSKHEGITLLQLHETIITRFLKAHATLLRQYEVAYGTPYIDPWHPYDCMHTPKIEQVTAAEG